MTNLTVYLLPPPPQAPGDSIKQRLARWERSPSVFVSAGIYPETSWFSNHFISQATPLRAMMVPYFVDNLKKLLKLMLFWPLST